MGLLLHGDAAFAGQGVVHEGFEMSELRGFRTGGTVHLIVNNQIGFTTSPAYARSSPYPSDVARSVQAPIFHVNGDDPEAVVHVARLAAEFRQRFKKDVVLDVWCYRRHGHNEADEPSFTQPLMYRKIAQHPTTRQIYARRLVEEQVLSEDAAQALYDSFQEQLAAAHEASTGYKMNKVDWLEGAWTGLSRAPEEYERGSTAVAVERLREIGLAMTEIPAELHIHRKLKRIIGQRRENIEQGQGIDWATAEHLAFGSLVRDGFPVRLSGQDSGRGTFSQRHAILYDQETEERYIPLNHLDPEQAPFEVVDSFLSEEGVLGFEYGYSLADPNSLVLWEAQFGDFCNGAQVYFDQFIASGEAKWLRMSGLVCLLPHGYEGQGPEHSSARLERFLQLYANDNLQVLYPSTPASYFHALRRQLHRPFRKPLIVMTPKSLLRHKLCTAQPRGDGRRQQLPSGDVRAAALPGRSRRHAGGPVQRQGLLRSGAAPAGARPRGGRGAAAARAAGAVPGHDPGRGAGALSQAGGGRVVPGGAAEHGRLELRRTAHRGGARADRHASGAGRPTPAGRPPPRRRAGSISSTCASRPAWSRQR